MRFERSTSCGLLALVLVAGWSATVRADTAVSGTISTNTTWTTAGSPYVLTGSVYVEGAGTPVLTIQPGVTVKFNSLSQLVVNYNNTGALQAIGTSTSPILFTANGSTTPGFWYALYFGSQAAATASQVTYATIEYGGSSAYSRGGIHVTALSPTFSNLTVRNNLYAGISVVGGSPSMTTVTLTGNSGPGLFVSAGSPTMSSSTVSSNTGYGLNVTGGSLDVRSTSITNNGNYAISALASSPLTTLTGMTASGNGTGKDLIERQAGTINASRTWVASSIPYVVTGTIYVEGSGTPVLTIQAGATVKFNSLSQLVVNYNNTGALQAIGTSTSPILFTANGSTTPGFWYALYFGSQAAATASQVTYATIEYGGSSAYSRGGIHVTALSPTFSNLTVRNNLYAGISVVGGSPAITASTLTGNSGPGLLVSAGSPSISSSTISSNTAGGVYLASPAAPSLQTVTISSNTGYAMSQDAGVTLGAVSGLTATGNTTDAIELRSGTVSANATWQNTGLPYIASGDVYVQKNGAPVPTLTIQAGVTVKLNSGVNFFVGPSYAGSLQAVGTSAQPINFTANTASPTAGYWRGIQLGVGTTGTQISYATVSYGGINSVSGGIYLNGCSPTISNVTVQNNAYSGLTVNGGAPVVSALTATANPWGAILFGSTTASISSSTISSNTAGGVYLTSPATPSLQTVTISSNTGYAMSQDAGVTLGAVSGLTATSNTTNGIEVRYSTAQVSTTWQNTGLPYIATGDIYVQKNGTPAPVLAIQPGATVKFNSGVNFFVGPSYGGSLQAVGTSAQPITFTANSVSPTAGYWRGIQLGPGTTGTQISYATVSYGGINSVSGGIYANGCSPTIHHVHFITNAHSGLTMNSSASVIINCDFIGNTAGLVNLTPAVVIDARLNWWNSITGPSGSGPGTGQSTSAGSRFEPWLAAAGSDPLWVTAVTLGNSTSNPAIGINANFTLATNLTGTWSLSLINGSGSTVRTISGSGVSGTPAWDGKNDGGVDQPDGTYSYQIASTSGAQSSSPARGRAYLDRTKQLAATSLLETPPYFSPNGDGIQDTTSLTAVSTFDGATWTVRVKNAGGTVLQTATGPAAPNIAYTWDGKNSSGTLQPEATYTLELTLVDGPANVVSTTNATLDLTFPTATMTSPAAGAVLSNIYQNGSTDVSVTGTGTDLNLSNWTVDFGSGTAPSSWTSIATGTTPVSAAQFASWATLGLTYGTYTLRLQVWDLAGNRSVVTRTESVGNFLVSGGSQTLYLAGAGTVSFTSVVPFTVTETVVVLNSQSQTIATLFNGQRNAGTYTDSWNGHDSSNALVPDGNYSVIATAVSGLSSLTVNPGPAPVSDSTPFVGYVMNGWSTAEFFPFNNNPFIGTYTFTNGTPPRPGRVWVLFTPNLNSVYFFQAAHISWCNWPGNFCAPAGDYQWPGTHTFSWLGIDPSGNIRFDIMAIVVMVTGETAGGNVVQVYGTQPAVTNFAIFPTYYRPGSGTLQITLNAATFQNRTVSASARFERLGVPGAVQTVTLTGQSPGALTLSWNGQSSTGPLVAAGQYLVTVTVTDSAGAQTVQQGLMTINY